jgi:hypothetical protein
MEYEVLHIVPGYNVPAFFRLGRAEDLRSATIKFQLAVMLQLHAD